MDHFDVAIIGAGVIGLAVAQRLSLASSHQSLSSVLLEQESSFGQQTSSRNSEVIHAGIYYAKNSLKAQLCVSGKVLLVEHCRQFNVPYSLVGKYIVAPKSSADELERLRQRAEDNGVGDLSWVDKNALVKAEPNVSADVALFSPSSGIVDSHSLMRSLLDLAEMSGTLYSPRTRVIEIERSNELFMISCEINTPGVSGATELYKFSAGNVINCAGLTAVDLAGRIEGVDPAVLPQLHLCKGDYFSYSGRSPFNHLIYPLPEANTVGLGIHSTMDMSGRVKFGPDTQYVERPDFVIDQGKAALFASQIARYFPAIQVENLQADYAGIRPKLAGPGEPAADFMIQDESDHQVPGLIQLFGMESPGLTSCLAIADHVIGLMQIN